MSGVDERPKGAKFRAVCFDDPDDVRRWYSALEEQVNDLHAVAWDRVRAKRRRVLSRHEAMRKMRAAWRALTQLLEAARVGLRPPSPPPPLDPTPSSPEDAAGSEAEAPLSERRVIEPPPGREGA